MNAKLMKESEGWHLLAFSPDLRSVPPVCGRISPPCTERRGNLIALGEQISNPLSPPLATFPAIDFPGKLAEKTASIDHMIAKHVTTGHKCE